MGLRFSSCGNGNGQTAAGKKYFSAKNPFLSWNLTPEEWGLVGDIIDWENPKTGSDNYVSKKSRLITIIFVTDFLVSNLVNIHQKVLQMIFYAFQSLWSCFEMSCDGPFIVFFAVVKTVLQRGDICSNLL